RRRDRQRGAGDGRGRGQPGGAGAAHFRLEPGRRRQLWPRPGARRGGRGSRPGRARRGAPTAGGAGGGLPAAAAGAPAPGRRPLRPPGPADGSRHPAHRRPRRRRRHHPAGPRVLPATQPGRGQGQGPAALRPGRGRRRQAAWRAAGRRQRGAVSQRRRSRAGGRGHVQGGGGRAGDRPGEGRQFRSRRHRAPARARRQRGHAGGDRRGAAGTLAAARPAGRRRSRGPGTVSQAEIIEAPNDIRGVLIQIEGGRLLLPNATVSEVLSYAAPEPIEGAPDWILGRIRWRGWQLPLVAWARLSGTAPDESGGLGSKVAVLKALHGNPRLPYFALLTQGFPRLVTVSRSALVADAGDGELPDAALASVMLNEDRALVPNLDAIASQIDAAL